MQLTITADRSVARHGEAVTIRLVALNDTLLPVALRHGLLVGPNPVAEQGPRPMPVSVDPEPAEETVLPPSSLFGRERRYAGLPAGTYTFHGYLVDAPSARLLPTGPADPGRLAVAALPVRITVLP